MANRIHDGNSPGSDLARTSIYDKFSGLMKVDTHLDHISRCKAAFGTNCSNKWTYRVFIVKTRRDEVLLDEVQVKHQ